MKLAVFTTNSCRMVENPVHLKEMLGWDNVVAEPDLTHVENVLPQFWKLEDGQIRPMNGIEIRIRKKIIKANGIDNQIRKLSAEDFKTEIKAFQVINSLQEKTEKINIAIAVMVAINFILSLVLLFKK